VQRQADEDRAEQDEQHPGLSDGGKEPRNQQGSVDVGLVQFQSRIQEVLPFRDGELDFPVNSGRSFKRAMLYARSEIDVEETS